MALKELKYNSLTPLQDKTSILSQQQNKEVKQILFSNDTLSKISDIETNTTIKSGLSVDGITVYNKKGFGSDLPGYGNSGLPYIQRKIGETWGNDGSLLESRIKTDEKRIDSFLNSAEGKRFINMQSSLQLMNPATDSIGELRFNRIYNPLSIPAAITGWSIGYHPERHGFFGTTPDYESIVKLKNIDALNLESLPSILTGNRLVRMLKEQTTDLGTLNLTLSSWGGPNSVGGAGSTLIFKHSDGIPFTRQRQTQLTQSKNTFENIVFKKDNLNRTFKYTRDYDYKSPYGSDKEQLNNVDSTTSSNYTSYHSTRLIPLLKEANESKNLPGWEMNYAINKDLQKYIDEDTYSKNNYVTTTQYKPELKQSSPTKGITRQSSDTIEEKSNIVDLFNKILDDKPNWNGDGNETINNSFNSAGGFKVFDPTVLNEVDSYNTIKGFSDLKNYTNSYNKRGNVTTPLFVSTPEWSNAGKAYKKTLGDRYFASMHDMNDENNMSPRIPDIGDIDPILLLEKDANNYDRSLDAKNGVENDFITFIVCGIQFRATISGLTYNFTPSWSDISYVGRSDVLRLYGGLSRDISFDFIVAALSKEEMDMIYYKLNQLACKVSPGVKNNRMIAPISTLTIGNLIKNEFGYLNSLSFTIDEDYSWDIDTYFQPMAIKVSCAWTIIGKESPTNKAYYFGKVIKSDDGTTKKYSNGATEKRPDTEPELDDQPSMGTEEDPFK